MFIDLLYSQPMVCEKEIRTKKKKKKRPPSSHVSTFEGKVALFK